MAQVYAPPEGFPAPDLREFLSDIPAYFKAVKEWEERLGLWCQEQTESESDLIGFVYHHPVADGQASYMVMKLRPLTLLELDSEYTLPEAHLRGLRVADIEQAKQRDEALAKLFSRNDAPTREED